MSQTLANSAVLTLDEVAEYLRLSPERVLRQVEQEGLPGRQIDGEWRFLKTIVDDWLKGSDQRLTLLRQAGALADDASLAALREAIYRDRQRPEAEDG